MNDIEKIFEGLKKTIVDKQQDTENLLKEISTIEKELEEMNQKISLLETVRNQLINDKTNMEKKLEELNKQAGRTKANELNFPLIKQDKINIDTKDEPEQTKKAIKKPITPRRRTRKLF